MTASLESSAEAKRVDPRLLAWLSLAVVFLLAVALRHVMPANNDVSWLLTVGERVLAGDRLYSDVIEVNPPASVLIYIPAILISHITGIKAEIIVDALLFVEIAASLGCVCLIISGSASLKYLQKTALLIFAFAVLAILPAQQFAQREHVALIACLPLMAVLARRAGGETPALWAIIPAGAGAGVTMVIKPYFAAAIFCAVVAAAACGRSWRMFFVAENWIAGAVVLAYFGFVAIYFPDFFTTVLPLIRDIYAPLRLPLWGILSHAVTVCWCVLILITVLLQRQKTRRSVVVLAAGSFGFAVAFVMQRKGFPYQAYPMLALGFLTAGAAAAAHGFSDKQARHLSAVAAVAITILFIKTIFTLVNDDDGSQLAPRLRSYGERPALLVISGELSMGHPLVRMLNGVWVSREPNLWITRFVAQMHARGMITPDQKAKLDGYVARERQWLVDDFKRRPPSIVLIDNFTAQYGAWAQADSELSQLLQSYKKVDSFGKIDILVPAAGVTSH